ncbi:MAG: zinc ribbon domain-containing protein [Chloroflexota bacterium]
MPIYEYVCQDCGERFEKMRSMKDADVPAACSKCAGNHTSRMLSLFNAQSGGRVVAGGSSGCASCSSSSCASCGVKH